ncbi:MAG TPA: hypothetical protein VFI27_17310, partial [candidate division Zixibacteria bacterium]|nr:hypothetical protein [candidate division Zixibacteria bacterium]
QCLQQARRGFAGGSQCHCRAKRVAIMMGGSDNLDLQNAQICLEPVTGDNWKACIALELAPGQEYFVPSNLYSIAEAQFYAEARSSAVYNENGQLVGYVPYGRNVGTYPSDDAIFIF